MKTEKEGKEGMARDEKGEEKMEEEAGGMEAGEVLRLLNVDCLLSGFGGSCLR